MMVVLMMMIMMMIMRWGRGWKVSAKRKNVTNSCYDNEYKISMYRKGEFMTKHSDDLSEMSTLEQRWTILSFSVDVRYEIKGEMT